MTRNNNNYPWKGTIGLFLVCLIALFLFTYVHELMHAKINEKYGCTSNIYFVWQGGRTATLCDVNTTDLVAHEAEQQNLDDSAHFYAPWLAVLFPVSVFVFFKRRKWLD